MSSPRTLRIALAALVVVHGAIIFAGFFSPYDPTLQNRLYPFVPPTHLHWMDRQGRFHLHPFVYRWVVRPGSFAAYQQDESVPSPVRFLVPGVPYKIAGLLVCRWHLFGVEEPFRIFIMGSDAYGRDQFSRLLYGGQISLLAGLLASAVSLGLGLMLGAIAGFYGRWIDHVIMRTVELFLALPWLYLLFAARAFLPLHINAAQAFFLLVTVMGLIGWGRPARLVRGVVLSAREREYVLAARGFGASDLYLFSRHILPQLSSVLLTQATLLIPQYILAEVILSFLGLGVSEPSASWGTMLATLQQYHVLVSYWWMLLPGLALIPIFLTYYTLADCLRSGFTTAPRWAG